MLQIFERRTRNKRFPMFEIIWILLFSNAVVQFFVIFLCHFYQYWQYVALIFFLFFCTNFVHHWKQENNLVSFVEQLECVLQYLIYYLLILTCCCIIANLAIIFKLCSFNSFVFIGYVFFIVCLFLVDLASELLFFSLLYDIDYIFYYLLSFFKFARVNND